MAEAREIDAELHEPGNPDFEERAVEQSTVPMERSHPTQTFVVKPPPFERQGVAIDDLIDETLLPTR